jgi:hypothetical protein
MAGFSAEHAKKLRKALDRCQSLISRELGMEVCLDVGSITYDKSQIKFTTKVKLRGTQSLLHCSRGSSSINRDALLFFVD